MGRDCKVASTVRGVALINRFRPNAALWAALTIAGCSPPAPSTEEGRGEVVRFINGAWYGGAGFVDETMFVRDGVFIRLPRAASMKTIDLDGGYVVPAFAEAHHHTVLCDPDRIEQFVRSGVLYAAIMNARVSSRKCEGELHGKVGLEVVSALAGVTAHDAHPSQIGLYFLDESEIDGEWVHYMDGPEDIDAVWPRIETTSPDFVKIFLSYSEDHDRLRADPSLASWYRGLDPAVVAPLVERAHGAGLRVAAHVMSAHDFDVAVHGGVDIIAHMPGFAPGAAFTENDTHPYLAELAADPARYVISEEAAKAAAARGVPVITTVSGREGPPTSAVRRNFAILRAAGVTLLVGSDRGEFNSVDEAEYLVKHDLVPPKEILDSLTSATTKVFFPDRRVGEFSTGAEATFVILGADPLADFSAIRDVTLVVKRGQALWPKSGWNVDDAKRDRATQ